MPTVIIPDKLCKKCGGTRWGVYPRLTGGTNYTCLTCIAESSKKWVIENREKSRIIKRRYNESHPDAQINYQKKIRTTPEGKARLYKNVRNSIKKASKLLSDSYIKIVIYNTIVNSTGEKIIRCNITQEQIERYRMGILALRKLKEIH